MGRVESPPDTVTICTGMLKGGMNLFLLLAVPGLLREASFGRGSVAANQSCHKSHLLDPYESACCLQTHVFLPYSSFSQSPASRPFPTCSTLAITSIMPRSSRGSSPRAAPPRPAPAPARAPAPQQQRPMSTQTAHPPAQQAPPAQASQGPGLFGQMASTAA